MLYFFLYSVGLVICVLSIDRNSSSFWESFLAPAGAWVFGILLVLWLLKRLNKGDRGSGGGYGGDGGFWSGDSGSGDGGGCGGGGD